MWEGGGQERDGKVCEMRRGIRHAGGTAGEEGRGAGGIHEGKIGLMRQVMGIMEAEAGKGYSGGTQECWGRWRVRLGGGVRSHTHTIRPEFCTADGVGQHQGQDGWH